ncbi:hypothetical protein ACFOLG_16135 [Vogesella facilis]|uniref:AAA+ ATPase domain-containing protein n=1 Tax=Vogesella facilis TaxID=1655232 RepID=A0ABV7RI19_9NEIS
MPNDPKRSPLKGTQVVSAVATGGGGGVFQTRVAALYLANMLTGLPTTFGLQGGRAETLRFEARYTGAHTDDIYCQLLDKEGVRLQLIQCKRGLNAIPSNTEFIDSLQGAWRDFLGEEGSPFNRASDVLVIATVAPGTPANHAAKRLCELSRASVDLADFLQKLESKLFDAQHKRTWGSFKEVSKNTLQEKYDEEIVFALLQRLRVDIHDLGVEASQELSLVQALLNSGHPGDSGEQVWNGLFSYVFEQGVNVGTVTRETWKATAMAGLQEAVSRVAGQRGLGGIAERFSDRASLQLSFISTSLPNGKHIPRGQCAAQVLAGFDEHQVVIVTGGAGAGKSAVIAELAPLLRESGPLFFFRADELDQPSLSAVQSLSGMPDALLSLDKLLRNGTPTIVIDSLEKALEARAPGALEELLTLVRTHKTVRLCVSTRSYAVNALFANFLFNFSFQIVDVPQLTDAELFAAVAGTPLESLVITDDSVREVLRAPFYLRLAISHMSAGAALPQATASALRLALWTEKVAPSKGLASGLAARRRTAFDEVCYTRTERFSQFVDAPVDAEAVTSLVHDGVLSKDAADRVAPAHDVLEDWSLFFRVAREVRGAERDWGALFGKLGLHAGMRRALRAWTALRSDEGDEDSYALLEAALAQDQAIPQLWRDEIAIGLLRSERVDELIAKLGSNVSFNSAALLQRLSHLLRVACKGPTSIDYSAMTEDPGFNEIRLRFGMAAPIGKAWDVLIGLVAKVFPGLPPESHSWVVQLAEDATSHDANWYKPSQRTLDVFNIAEHFCKKDADTWFQERTVAKRFFALLCRCLGAAPTKFEEFIEGLLKRIAADSDGRDFHAEERLQFLVDVNNCREACFFVPDLVWRVFKALNIELEPRKPHRFGMGGWEAELGLSERAAHKFFPPSALQGPFRTLLLYAWPKSVISVVELCNHAARSLAKTAEDEVIIIPGEQSPNGRPHIHSFSLWSTYRGLSVTSYLLNSALMALEERLLIEAKPQPRIISRVLEVILERGESSFTTGLVASVLIAHPELVTEKLLSIFKCPQFFSNDIARSVQEGGALAIHGGHDGLDDARQQERVTSNRLAHRRQHLEVLVLKLQLQQPELREAIFSILDTHLGALKGATNVPDGWRMSLKRMDSRGLTLGEPTVDSKWVPLEIANLEPELKQASDDAEVRMARMNRISGLRTWAAAIMGRFSGAPPATRERFSSASEAYEEFVSVAKEVENDEAAMFTGLEDELAYALCTKWSSEDSEALRWARSLVLERTAIVEDKDAWPSRDHSLGEARARTVIGLAAVDPSQAKMGEALANIITEPMWKLRRVAAEAIAVDLTPRQPMLTEVLVTGLAQYAEALTKGLTAPYGRRRDVVDEAREATVYSLSEALLQAKPCIRPSPSCLVGIKEWLIAISAARNEASDTWRIQSLITLAKLVADQEGGPRSDPHDPDHVDFETRRELADSLAAELLTQSDNASPLFAALDYCIDNAPKLTARLLESALIDSAKKEFANSSALWRIWDRATAKVFPQASLRAKGRGLYSKYDEVLRTLLLCSVPWGKGFNDLVLLKSRPRFIADCLIAVGDSRTGLRYLLQIAAGVGRVSALPSALLQLRDALNQAPADMLDDGNCLWDAETICRVTIHEHREELIRDARLRKATLDILDRLVDAGSSLSFQLRDYLATSPTSPAGL